MPLSPYVPLAWIGWSLAAALLLSWPLIWRWGRSAERDCGLALMLAITLDLGIQLIAMPVNLAHTAGNVLALSLLTRNALISARFYPLVMAAAQLIAVIVHALFWLGLINGAASYPILLGAMDAATLTALWAGCAQLQFWPDSAPINARIADAVRLPYRRSRTAGIHDRH